MGGFDWLIELMRCTIFFKVIHSIDSRLSTFHYKQRTTAEIKFIITKCPTKLGSFLWIFVLLWEPIYPV